MDGFRFRRQHPIGPYILDFYCVELKVAIEVDGIQHDPVRDARRDSWLLEQGIRTIRIPAKELLDDFDEVVAGLYTAIKDWN